MNMLRRLATLALTGALWASDLAVTSNQAAERPRLIVSTDIGGDPDDRQSLIRLMLYADEFDIEALIASAAGVPGQLSAAVVRPDLIREIVTAYGQVQPNLRLHDPGYPEAATLLARIVAGNPNRGTAQVGADHDTDASRRIIAVVDAADDRPVHYAIWGGQTDLAQALWRVRNDRGAAGLAAFIAKLRVYDVSDQDGIAHWMIAQFPGLHYILSRSATTDKLNAAHRGMYLGGDESLTSRAWLNDHVRTGHGPLGALYPDATYTAPNPHKGLKEGDTTSWFYVLPRGLNDPAHPEWGGWGGRFALGPESIYVDAVDTVDGRTGPRETVNRWRPAYQAEFQARMDWCVRPVSEANHAPVVSVNDVPGTGVVLLTVDAGTSVDLSAAASDPDGQPMTFRWWQYREPSTYGASVAISADVTAHARITVPADAAGTTIHVVLEVADQGTPILTTFRRVVLQVRPAR